MLPSAGPRGPLLLISLFVEYQNSCCSVLQDKYTNAFLAPKGTTEDKNFVLELTENYGVDSYNLGSGFGHFALAVPDVYKTAEAIKKSGESPSHCPGQASCCSCSYVSTKCWSAHKRCVVQSPVSTPHRDHSLAA